MPDSISVSIAKAIESAIEGKILSQQNFDLVRSYAEWDIDLSKIDSNELPEEEKLRVDITSYTTDQEVEQLSRSAVQLRVATDIAVRRKFGPNYQNEGTGRIEIAEIDALMLFIQELVLLFSEFELPGVRWESTNIVEAPVREHLRELRQFTGVLRIIFLANIAT